MPQAPTNLDDLKAIVATEKQLLPVGNRTKLPLTQCDDATLVSLRSLQGISEYEPSEFTFTALAGTSLDEVQCALAQKNQYLPFDPMLVEAGATLGGTVAAGLSGPGRFRYGGIRDFLLGVQFISGDGKIIRAGGKVVKNAAGFDLPKYLVGSLGRFGVLTSLTFKVFPKRPVTISLQVACDSQTQAASRIAEAAASRWELDAIDYRPDKQFIFLRLAGPQRACESLADEIRNLWGSDVSDLQTAEAFWKSVVELNWFDDGLLAVKVPTTSQQFFKLYDSLAHNEQIQIHGSVAGNIAWILLKSSESLSELDTQLSALELPGLILRGACDHPRLGAWQSSTIQQAIQQAMDPAGHFCSF